jgi:hypothetical protein
MICPGDPLSLLPETKLLIGEYGNASFDWGEFPEGDPIAGTAAWKRVVAAEESLVAHLEENYAPRK